MINRTSKEVRSGERVTTLLSHNGIGLAYIVDGELWETTGSYWANRCSLGMFEVEGILRDDGSFYLNAARTLNFRVNEDVSRSATEQLRLLNLL